MDISKEKLLKIIKERMKLLGINYTKMAKNLDTTHTSISRILNGKQRLLMDDLFRFSTALSMRTSDLVYESENSEKNVVFPHPVTANEIIELYKMVPLQPEGGYFKEIYQSKGKCTNLPKQFLGNRRYSTAIYYLLRKGEKSLLHRIKSDEVWHFYLGGRMTIVQISPSGVLEEITLGKDVRRGESVFHVVPAGYWFGAYPNSTTQFSFVGCTVSPGFDYADFEMAKREKLVLKFPEHKDQIEFLT